MNTLGLMESQLKVPVIQSFDYFFVVSLDNILNKQLNCLWNEMPSGLCDVTLMIIMTEYIKFYQGVV